MRVESILLLSMVIIFSCQVDRVPDEAQKLYLTIKEKDLKEFKSWNIYLREGKDNVFLFDYIPNEDLISRYLIVDNDSVIFKEIFPKSDSIFHHLDEDSQVIGSEKVELTKKIFFDFKSLGIDRISYNNNDSVFLLRKGKIMLLYATDKDIEITEIEKYKMYQKIASNWYYYEY